ncbi:calmodulin-A [Macrolepiota fuliginosa MF-IS2]|uniref:Calmodulin-A n=1 Tax=Macrolepiota fuliginosa MF-IS2 TaxID=1400762 RepID=A0A9P5XJM7_9AGAR|nr:calmodulin-A [Macrolepiota fuliginosa MF-IS2]
MPLTRDIAERISAYRDSFQLFDKDGNGAISPQELTDVMRDLGQTPTEAELKVIMRDLDTNKDGNIDFSEFLCLMSARSKVSRTGKVDDNEDEIRETFKVFDKDGNGSINLEELKTVMKNLGVKVTDEECKMMMKEADEDGNGVVDFNEFRRVSFIHPT